MNKWGKIIIFFICTSSQLLGQGGIITHNDFTAQTLVNDIFASGACENIAIIQPIGDTRGIGYFENASEIIGLSSGILLSTGPTHHARGPNNETDTSGDFHDSTGDPDLDHLATASIADAVGIEFDFVPLDSFVSFRYVFASEEYCEFVGSEFNDVFGFFISGPGINGDFSNQANNVALIPGTDDYVAINSVNFNDNDQWYVHNERNEDLNRCDLSGVSPEHLTEIEYDGFTTVMTAIIKLYPCETYHIRMVVGDVSDGFFDSAVFLEAGSFDLGGEIQVQAMSESQGEGRVLEGCEDGFFRFSRSLASEIGHPLSVDYYTSTSSTADSGIDYEPLAGSITIPAGEEYIDLPFISLNDDIIEGEEFMRLVLDIPCACYSDSTDMFIIPSPVLESRLTDAYTCPEIPVTLTIDVDGGIEPYEYEWSAGGMENTLEIDVENGQWHQVTVTDACGHVLVDSAQVWENAPPEASLMGDQSICEGDTAWFDLSLEGIAPFVIGYQLNEDTTRFLELSNGGFFPATEGGQYTLLTVEDAACLSLAEGEANVTLWTVNATAELLNPLCAGDANGAIEIDIMDGQPPLQIFWGGQEQEMLMDSLEEGLYDIEIVDSRNCSAFYFWEIVAPRPIQPPLVDCDALSLGNYMPSASGGTRPYLYAVDQGEWQSDDWHHTLVEGQIVHLSIEDAHGCTLQTTWQYPVSFAEGMFEFPPIVEASLGTQVPLIPEWLIPLEYIETVQWLPAGQLTCSQCLEPAFNAISNESIQLLVTDIFGCQDSLTFDVKVDDKLDAFIPNAFSPNGDDTNDVWHIYASPYQVDRIENLVVFDRWGNFVFQANDWPINSERHGWDGTYKGESLDAAVFIYSITFRLVNGKSTTVNGTVTLMR